MKLFALIISLISVSSAVSVNHATDFAQIKATSGCPFDKKFDIKQDTLAQVAYDC